MHTGIKATVLAVMTIALVGVALYVIFDPTGTMVFRRNPDPVRIPYDIVITRVSIRIDGFKVGGAADYCLGMWRTEEPVYQPPVGRGGFVEPFCLNTVRSRPIEGWVYPTGPQDGPVLVPAGDWAQEVDLRDTPIFVPEGTMFICDSVGAVSSIHPAERMDGKCEVEYTRYVPGKPKYRFLRLPYYDQTFTADEPLVRSYYQAYVGGRPLEIPSAVAYIGNNNHGSHMSACLRKSRNGNIIDTFCFPAANQDSPGLVKIGWTINEGERVGLDCHYPAEDKTSSGDCAIYLVAKLPDDLAHSPENAFRYYGELPRDYVPEWCAKTASILKAERVENPMLCLGNSGDVCSFEQKMQNCLRSFAAGGHPEAGCVADGSCYK